MEVEELELPTKYRIQIHVAQPKMGKCHISVFPYKERLEYNLPCAADQRALVIVKR